MSVDRNNSHDSVVTSDADHDAAHGISAATRSRPTDDPPTDGRSLRRLRNRAKVVDACLEMVASGHRGPSIDELAKYSGVSFRSIYRYFGTTTELIEAAIERGYEMLSPMLTIQDLGEGPLDDRIERFVDNRMALHAKSAQYTEAARSHTHEPAVTQLFGQVRALLGRQIGLHFGPELAGLDHEDRKARVAGIYVAFMHDSMAMLSSMYRDDPERIRSILVDHVRRHLTPPLGH